jgi:cytochrome c553
MSATVHRLCKRAPQLVKQIVAENPNATRAEQAAIFARMMEGPYRHLAEQAFRDMARHYAREFAAEGNANAVKMLARTRHKKRARKS